MRKTLLPLLLLAGLLFPLGALAAGTLVKKDTPAVTWNVDTGSSITATTRLTNVGGRIKRMFFVVPDLTGAGTTLAASLVLQDEALTVWSASGMAESATTDLDFLTTGVYVSGDVDLVVTSSVGQTTSPTLTVVFLREGSR